MRGRCWPRRSVSKPVTVCPGFSEIYGVFAYFLRNTDVPEHQTTLCRTTIAGEGTGTVP